MVNEDKKRNVQVQPDLNKAGVMRRPRSCANCRAFFQAAQKCTLGYEVRNIEPVERLTIDCTSYVVHVTAADMCPKPRTWAEYFAARNGA